MSRKTPYQTPYKKRVHLWRVFVGFVVVVTIGQVGLLYHYNSLLKSQETATAIQLHKKVTDVSANATSSAEKQAQQKLLELQQQYKGVTVSPDGRYATYLESVQPGATNTVHVMDLQSGQDVSEATNLYPVQSLTWLGDEEVFVGEQKAPGDLELNTFYIANGNQANQTAALVPEFTALSADAAITRVAYSQQTNDVFVLISTSSSSAIYHIGTMEHIQSVPFQDGYVKNIAVSETSHRLYVEALNNGHWNVYVLTQSSSASPDAQQYETTTQLVASNSALITVIQDELYYGSVDQNGLVTAVYKQSEGGVPTLVKTLSTPTLASDIEVQNNGTVTLNPVATPQCVVN